MISEHAILSVKTVFRIDLLKENWSIIYDCSQKTVSLTKKMWDFVEEYDAKNAKITVIIKTNTKIQNLS